MIHIDRTIVVEGKYDQIKLASVVEGLIIPTGGFAIYKDKEKQALLRALAQRTGLVVLTDSDAAGFQIRAFLRSICGKETIVDAYIPDLYGKEKRKTRPSKEGKLGVEGVPAEVVRRAFEQAGLLCSEDGPKPQVPPITKADLLRLGLTGCPDSSARRAKLLRELDLPEHLTTNALLTLLNATVGLTRLEELMSQDGEQA